MLTTERLIIRPARPDDLDDMFSYMSDARAMAYWSTPPHADRSVTKEVLDRMIGRAPPVTYLVFEHKGRVIGMGGRPAGNEIGYILHPDFWRQGFVSEAMNAIIPYLWQVTDLDHIFADVDPNNTGSCALVQAMGFHETHRKKNTFCINGVWSDSVYYRLDRPTDTEPT